MAELIDKKLVLKDIASWVVGGNPEEPEMVRIDELAMAIGVSIGRLPTTTEADIRAKAISEFASEIMKYINSSNRNNADYFIVDQIEELCSKYVGQSS